MKRDLLAALPLALALGLAGCAATGGAPVEPVVAASWQAPLPARRGERAAISCAGAAG